MPSLKTMRATLPAALLISALLAACATEKDVLTAKDIPQSGTLKVHPGLIKSPPAAQQPAAAKATPAPAPVAPSEAAAPATAPEPAATTPSETAGEATPDRQ
jgi:hypothetical protein